MYNLRGPLFSNKTKKKVDRMYFKEFILVGRQHRCLLKKRVALSALHITGGLTKKLFFQIQKMMKKLPNFINYNKLKEDAILVTKRQMGFKSTRILKNLPLRGQRTHTNAKTRKKRKVL
jgi:ribosomal protein S13